MIISVGVNGVSIEDNKKKREHKGKSIIDNPKNYYENIEFKVNDKVMYSGNKLKLDSMVGFNLVDSNKYELIYY